MRNNHQEIINAYVQSNQNSRHPVTRSVMYICCFVFLAGAASPPTKCSGDIRWATEYKNSTEALTPKQAAFVNATLPILNKDISSVAEKLRPLTLLLAGGTLTAETAAPLAKVSAEALYSLFANDPEIQKVTFMTGEYMKPLELSRCGTTIETHTDYDYKVEGLMSQVGFFPEGPSRPVDDYDGYPSPQFAVATNGHNRILIRVPVVSKGYYLGDITAEYLTRKALD